MKKTFLTALIVLIALAGFSQKALELTTTTAFDTTRVLESQITKVVNGATSGSTVFYSNQYGNYSSLNVIERVGDTTGAVGASLTLTLDFSSGDTLDSIRVAGVKITTVAVLFITSDSVTVDSLVQSINLGASVYTASRPVGTSNLVITAPKANAQSYNGNDVTTFSASEATLDGSQGALSGGVSKGRNIISLSSRLFELQDGTAISADKVRVLIKRTGGCDVWLEDDQVRVINSTSKCKTITTAINAL